jgi:hypothetical protein
MACRAGATAVFVEHDSRVAVWLDLLSRTCGEYWARALALGIRLDSGVLCAGDRIANEQPVDFVEEDVTSLQLNGQDVEEAGAMCRGHEEVHACGQAVVATARSARSRPASGRAYQRGAVRQYVGSRAVR